MLRVTLERAGAALGAPLDLADGRALIGAAADCAVRLPVTVAADAHAYLTHGDGAPPRLHALAALVVDGEALAAGAERALVLPTRLEIGELALRLEVSTATRPSSALRTASLARELVRQLLGGEAPPPASEAPPAVTVAPTPIELVLERGPGRDRRRRVAGRVVIGRGDDADWVLPDRDLSRHHAAVELDGEHARVVDLGSKNGTRLDGALVPVGGAPLPVGAAIELGRSRLRRVAPGAALAAPTPLPVEFYLALAVAALAVAALGWIVVTGLA
ncbi:MAG: FHA domain-containing protein [Kofleriaceae bacterium]